MRQKVFQESESDYLDLFKPDAPWTKSAKMVKVCMINGAVVMHQTNEEKLAIFADLKRRQSALAIEMGGLLSGKDSTDAQACGVGGFDST